MSHRLLKKATFRAVYEAKAAIFMCVQHREVGQVVYSKASQKKDKKNINSMLKSYLIKQQQLITQF